MFRGAASFAATPILIVAALLAALPQAVAQRHGGGRGGAVGGLGSISRPDGVDDRDTLKDFHRVIAAQATGPQITEFQALLKNTEAAQSALQSFAQAPGKENSGSTAVSAMTQSVDLALSGSRKFQDGFSSAQKSGLREAMKRLAKSDSDVEAVEKRLVQSLDAKANANELSAHAEGLEKALADFHTQQLALGAEMSMVLATGQDVTFTLPQVRPSVTIGRETITVPASGVLSQIAAQNGKRTLHMEFAADLSELQQNITEVLRSQLDRYQNCGERVAIRRATLIPEGSSAEMTIQLHYERWTCGRTFGQSSSTELAEGDTAVEVKLAASADANAIKVGVTFGRTDATGMLGDELRSGSLGDDLRDKISQVVLFAVSAGTNLKTTLPAAIQNSAAIRSAKFEDAGVGNLGILLDGQMEISDEQANALASQLNQALAQKAVASTQ